MNLLARQRAELGDEVHVLALGSRAGPTYFPYPPEVGIETSDADAAHPVLRLVARLR